MPAKPMYKCVPYIARRKAGWNIIENATNMRISSSVLEEEALNHMNYLENGGGFAGLTPFFFAEGKKHAILNLDD